MELGLKGKKVAILAADGVEESELVGPRKALDDAGAVTEIISPAGGEIQTVSERANGQRVKVDRVLAEVRAADYEALLLPGGDASPKTLQGDGHAVQLIREFMLADKPVAAICHGASLLVKADAVAGRTLTSSPAVKNEIQDAGGDWVDEPVHVDGRLITSRKPGDLPAFIARVVKEFGNKIDERKVDMMSEQSFPASDPPAMP